MGVVNEVYDNCQVVGDYGFPRLQSCGKVPEELLPFNYAMTARKYNTWVHFFLDDSQFERIWNFPERYLSVLRKFEGVLAPDFSMFSDMPKAQQIYNCWRSRVLSAWFQMNGLKVIPVIEWSDRSSLEWCLDGLPKNSTVAVQTNGCFKDLRSKRNLILGMEYASRELNPSSIIVYGRGTEYRNYFRNIYFYESYCQNLKKRL